MAQEGSFAKYITKISIFVSTIIITSCWAGYYIFTTKLRNHMQLCRQEQQISIEQLNNKLIKLNKQFILAKEENKYLHATKRNLEKQLKELQVIKKNIEYEITQLKHQMAHLTEEHGIEKNNLLAKNNLLKKNNDHLQELVKELHLQIKNHKDTTYNLFQAGKLEVELSKVEQQLSEHYDNMLQKKSNLSYLKNKCGSLKMNTSFCKEYDVSLESVSFLEQQIMLLTAKKDDLKQRINAYLASSK